MLWERCAGTSGYMSFSVANKRGETFEVVITYIPSCICPFFQRDKKIRATCTHIAATSLTSSSYPKRL